MISTGAALRAARLARRMSQGDLGELLGVTAGAVCRLEQAAMLTRKIGLAVTAAMAGIEVVDGPPPAHVRAGRSGRPRRAG